MRAGNRQEEEIPRPAPVRTRPQGSWGSLSCAKRPAGTRGQGLGFLQGSEVGMGVGEVAVGSRVGGASRPHLPGPPTPQGQLGNPRTSTAARVGGNPEELASALVSGGINTETGKPDLSRIWCRKL